MLLTQHCDVIYGIVYGDSMLGFIAVYQEIDALETAKVCISLRHWQLKAIGKSTYAAIHIFYNMTCQIHIPNGFISNASLLQ